MIETIKGEEREKDASVHHFNHFNDSTISGEEKNEN